MAGTAEEWPTGGASGVEEAPLPELKAAADNPDGTFVSAAAEAGPEGGEEETGRRSAPVMTEAVGPLVTAVEWRPGH